MKKAGFYDDRSIIHRTLRHYPRKQKVTQSGLAARLRTMRLNIDQQAVSKIERNRRIVTDYAPICICRALRISLEEILADFDRNYSRQR